MLSKVLIITSGGSQLLTQLSVLKKEYNDQDIHVSIIYNGVYRESLNLFFYEVASFCGYDYLGQINFNIAPNETKFKARLIDFFRRKNSNFIITKFPLLKNFQKVNLLSIPIRVKMFSDIVLLSFLKPSNIFYTVDGVVDELPLRKYSKFKYPYLKNYLRKIPVKEFVFSPNYLQKDADKVGKYKEISLNPVLQHLSNLLIVKEFKRKYLGDKVDYLIFSQHYSLNEEVVFKNEIEFYKRAICKICHLKKNVNILFKPHPRDTKDKIEAIKNLNIERLVIIEEFFQAVPVEFFIDEFVEMDSIFITGNSSAPLCFQKKDKIVSVFSNELLTIKLNAKINEFAISNELQLMEV
jgi:hypothetical protein